MGNSIVYFELIGPDRARLGAPYSQVFSWYRPPGAPVAAHISEQPEYLFIPPGDDAPPAAGGIGGGPGYAGRSIFYVGVTDVNGALAKPRDSVGKLCCPHSETTVAESPLPISMIPPATSSASLVRPDPPDSHLVSGDGHRPLRSGLNRCRCPTLARRRVPRACPGRSDADPDP